MGKENGEKCEHGKERQELEIGHGEEVKRSIKEGEIPPMDMMIVERDGCKKGVGMTEEVGQNTVEVMDRR